MHEREIDGERKTRGRKSGRREAEKACVNSHERAGVGRTSTASGGHGKEAEYGAEQACEGGKEGREEERKSERGAWVDSVTTGWYKNSGEGGG